MSDPRLEKIESNDRGLASALSSASLPTNDLSDDGRSLFALIDVADAIVGYSGLEPRGSDVLPRSIVTLPESRQAGPGRKLTQLTVARTSATADICLATTGAACFFETSGFETVSGSDLPLAVTATRQLPGLCRASATAVKLTRPPT